MREVKFGAKIRAIGKPRMTRSDKWKKRKCVVDYRIWADALRLLAAGHDLPKDVIAVKVECAIAMPKSWSLKKMAAMEGKPHREKPDWDNIAKAVCDTLFEEDKMIASGTVTKWWAYSANECMFITIKGE